MKTIKTIFEIVGYFSTAVVALGILIGFISWVRGILPAIWRLGKGLAGRKIAIFAQGDHLTSLESLLQDSKLFRKNNIVAVPEVEDIGRAEDTTVFLVHWGDWQDDIEVVLKAKKDTTALVVYAPPIEPIRDQPFKRLSEVRNVTVTNFRGRLLNDLVISMITTGYK
jgi:hypothetical protein